MRTAQFELIDALIDPIPVFGPALADLFYTWASFSDAMNLRRANDGTPSLPPTEKVAQVRDSVTVTELRQAA
jgi:hypothetical protein